VLRELGNGEAITRGSPIYSDRMIFRDVLQADNSGYPTRRSHVVFTFDSLIVRVAGSLTWVYWRLNLPNVSVDGTSA
jgi:hypothetical protein